jgi:hypothetical protein
VIRPQLKWNAPSDNIYTTLPASRSDAEDPASSTGGPPFNLNKYHHAAGFRRQHG